MTQSIRTRNPDASRTAILDAAEQILVEKGYAGTSMREIAELSGKSKGLIHHYFGSKSEIWEAVKKRYGHQFKEILLPFLKNKPIDVESFKSWTRRYLRFLIDNPNLSRIMLWRHLEGDLEPWEGTNELYELAITKIKESQNKGIFRSNFSPGHLIYLLSGSHLHWVTNRLIFCTRNGLDSADPAVDEEYLQDLENFILNGIRR